MIGFLVLVVIDVVVIISFILVSCSFFFLFLFEIMLERSFRVLVGVLDARDMAIDASSNIRVLDLVVIRAMIAP